MMTYAVLFNNLSFENLPFLEEHLQASSLHRGALDKSFGNLYEAMHNSSLEGTDNKQNTSYLPLKELRIERLIDVFRMWGYQEACFYPEGIKIFEKSEMLAHALAQFKEEEYAEEFPTCGLLPQQRASLHEIIKTLQKVYAGRVGIEYMCFCSDTVCQWIQKAIEPFQGTPSCSKEEKWTLLHLLNRAEVFETFLHMKYVGHKRFSIEGAETLIPLLQSIIEEASSQGIQEMVIGMPHRGRVNVLVNILNKSLDDIFAEFEGGVPQHFSGSGDVKYHKGFSSKVKTQGHAPFTVVMPANPSHLESVGPVVEGIARAKITQQGVSVIPVIVHGDAAISGQGVVYETMQMAKLGAYATGGTIHIVLNNHIGFTTLPQDGRSTPYCTDIAKAFSMPIFHINAEDPEMCAWIIRIAVQLRTQFSCDVCIDLNCWRKWGHNESDEPAYTQPLLYEVIRKKETIRTRYHTQLLKEGTVEKRYAEKLEKEFRDLLQNALEVFRGKKEPKEEKVSENGILEKPLVRSMVAQKKLVDTIHSISSFPEGFIPHARLQASFQKRIEEVDKEKEQFFVDWGLAETLAFATLLQEGVSIRFSGQDSRRGTFSHRHGMVVCQKTGSTYFPLEQFAKEAQFELWDSFLSEFGALGFEYGFSIQASEWLTVWEAQFGDFANSAQIVIDQYIVAGEEKWGVTSSLCLFLPHGYEGHGPEHSSARMERYLTLAAQDNIIITVPSTTAQWFHLLRRHAYSKKKKPLVVFTPKGLLRFTPSFSRLNDLSNGSFARVIDDSEAAKDIEMIVFCTGHIYYELKKEQQKHAAPIAFIRIEQLYPFPENEIKMILSKYREVHNIFWVQEEPNNMGAWHFIKDRFEALETKKTIQYIGRNASASPACGSEMQHEYERETIIHTLFTREHL